MSAKNQRGLGKGFDMLMPQGLENVLVEKGKDRVQNVFTKDITPNPEQPRRTFDEEALKELADSIKQYGVLQPLLVTSTSQGKFQIIAGERRWRASKLAGLDKIPVVVRTSKDLEKLEIALTENIQRVDLSPLEQAASIQRLHELFSVSMEDIAKRLGKAPSTVTNIVRLLQLPPAAQDALLHNRISEGHARSILALKDYPEQQEQLLLLIQKHGWSVRQAEQFVIAAKTGAASTERATQHTRSETPETERLSKLLGSDVRVQNMAQGKGRLIISFKSPSDFERLVRLLDEIKP